MKKFTVLFITILSLFSTTHQLSSYAAEKTNNEIYDEVIETWNYLHNTLEAAVNDAIAKTNEISSKVDNINVSTDIKKQTTEALDEYGGDIKSAGKITDSVSFPEAILSTANSMWTFVAKELKNGSGGEGTFFKKHSIVMTPDKYTEIQNVMKVFGYSLVLVFFAATLIESTIKYEIFTLKGGAMIFGRIIISKFIIDISVTLCMGIIDGISDITSKVLDLNDATIFQFPSPIVNIPESDVKFIGPLIDMFTGLLVSIPLVLSAFCVMICSIFVLLRLILRSFELAMLVSVSPAFFACVSSDITKPYFKNFIVTLIGCAAQVLFMAIVLQIGTKTITFTPPAINSVSDIVPWLTMEIPFIVLIIAMTVMLIKPPKVLTGLVK